MRVFILTNNLSGLLAFRKELLVALKEKGYDVSVSSPRDIRAEELEQLGIPLISTDINRRNTNPIKDFSLIVNYINILRKGKPDMVLTYTIKPNIYGGLASRIMRIPQIANITGLGTAVENPSKLQKFIFSLYKLGMRKTRTVFFQNPANRDFCLKHNLIKSSYRVIPGSGVNLDRFSPLPYPDESVIKFLFIGRAMRDKGINHYIEAAKKIKAANDKVEFHVIGACEEGYENIIQEASNKGIIIYHGVQKDIRPFIEQAHCLIHPSYHEGMSNVCLEMAASARPIITTDVPGCRETVDDGVTGFIVKPKDTDSVIAAVRKFLKMPYKQRRQMGLAGRKKVEREFDRNIVINAYLEEIEKIKG